jgi:autotransporter-associated beta strand protein
MNPIAIRIPMTSIHASVFTTARLILAVALLLAAASAAQAATLHWDGSSSAYWGTAANWVENQVPVDGDSLVFPGTAMNKYNTNNLAGLNLDSIEVEGAGYSLNGNSVGLSGMLWISVNALIVTEVRMDLSLDDSASIHTYSFLNNLHVYGNISLGGHDLDVGGYGNVLLYGVVSGAGSVTKYGNGTVTILGSSGNTYTGSTTVEEGTLVLNKTLGNSVPHALIIGGNDAGDPSATARHDSAGEIGSDVTINRMGTYDMNGYSETILDLNLNGGADFDSGTATLTVAGDVTVDGGISVIAGNVALYPGDRQFNILYNGIIMWPGAHCHLTADVSGSGNLIKTGPGIMRISGNNTYSGTTLVEDGDVIIDSNTALGTTAAGTTVNAGSLMYISVFSTSTHVGNEALTLGGDIYSGGDSNSWEGNVGLTGDVEIDVRGNYLNLAGAISGTGGFTKEGDGTLILSGSTYNSFTGATVVNDGQLLLGKTAASPYYAIGYGPLTVGDGSGAAGSALVRELEQFQLGSIPITVNGDGLLDLNNFYDTVGNSLTLNEGGDVQTGAAGTIAMGANSQITVDSSSASSTISGNMSVGSGACTFDIADGSLYVTASVSGSANITKTGGGYMYLQSSNSFTGTMTVDQFYLAISDPWALGSEAAGTYVNNSALLGVFGNTAVGNESLTMNSSYSSGAIWVGSGSNSWAGPVTLSRDTTVRVYAGDCLNLIGPIGGAGGLTKLEDGTLILSGSSGNTYTGDTIVEAGTLELAKTAGTGVAIRYGSLTIGDGDGGASADVVRFTENNQFWSTVPVTITASGLLDFNGHADTVGPLTFTGGRATSGSSGGLMYLASTVTATNGSGTLQGNVYVASTRTFNAAETSGANLYVEAQVTGLGGLTKTGPGQLYLSSSNSYEGITTISEGRVYADDDFSLGATSGGTVVSDGTALVLRFGAHIGDEPLALNGNGQSTLGALASIYGSNSWAGPITLASPARLTTLQASDYLHLSGAIGGTGDVTFAGSGTVILSGSSPNTYTGETFVYGGTLELAKTSGDGAIPGNLVIGDGSGGADADVVRLKRSNQIANTADVTIASSGLFDLDGYYDRMDAFTGSGSVALGSGHLIAGHSGSSFTFDGLASGSGYLWKVGTGTWTLTGDNTYSGTTRIETGTLIVNGFQPDSDVLVQTAGTLGGVGTVAGINSQGTVAPGSSPGQLRSGNVALNSGSTFAVELDGYVVGSGYDQLNLKGTVDVTGAILDVTLGYLPAVGDSFVILNNDSTDAVVGTFAGLADGASLTASNATLVIDYNGGTGNDVVLTVTNVTAVEPLRFTSVQAAGSDVALAWEGGVPFYVLEKKSALTNSLWQPVTPPMRFLQTNLPMDTPNGFYRVSGGN